MVECGGAGWPRLAPLAGFRVGVTAGARRDDYLDALSGSGAHVVPGPSVAAISLAEREALEAAIEQVLLRPPDVVVLAGDVSPERWRDVVEGLGRGPAVGDALDGARVVAGTDALALAARPGGGRVAVATDATAAGARIVAAVRRAGADVIELAVPPCPRPADAGPALALVEEVVDRRVEAVVFTSPDEVRNLLDLASGAGRDEELVAALAGDVLVACAGTSCADAAAACGMAPVYRSGPPRVGPMVEALTEALAATIVRLRLAGVAVVLRGTLAVVGGEPVTLTGRERALLAVLARRPGVVVAKSDLLRRVWRSRAGDGTDGHAVEVAVARLRLRLGPAGAGLQAVPRRGYRLVVG